MTDETPNELRVLHDDVERRAGQLAERHAARLQCRRGCHACCVDDLTVFEVEAQRIRCGHETLLREQRPHPPGACAFLDARGACRIYADRPYVCRTQGLPLRWFVEDESGDIHEQRDICPLNEDGPPLEELDADACWWIGPTELALSGLQDRIQGHEGRRIALRDLFDSDAGARAHE